ncbi:MAG: putative drug exporter of the superfamily [Frankiales bacterium]|jgi:RND superfamily putative drug exporter|nr:putative drug exporter of the superfamily [Frankiales bacterium]
MLGRLADVLIRRRRLVLAITGLGLVMAAVVGGGVANRLNSGGFTDPNNESSHAATVLDDTFHLGSPNFWLLVTAPGGVDRPDAVAAGRDLTARLAQEPGLTQVVSYWTSGGDAALRSRDSHKALVIAVVRGSDDQIRHRVEQLTPKYTGTAGPLSVRTGGIAQVYSEVSHQIRDDLARAELIAIPITLVLLIIVFASVIAALMPLAIAGIAVFGSFFILTVLVSVTHVSIFALNMVTAMGLGLAIDYSLFIVTRYREELHAGRDVNDAIRVTLMTAGRTVVFSSLTVALALAALLVFPLYFLRSFAYAGIAVTLLAGVGAIVVLPALLAVVGKRIDRFSLRRRPPKPDHEGLWHRIALGVMRRPIPIATAIVGLLIVLGLPFLGVHFGLPDDRVLPPSANAHVVGDVVRSEFPGGQANQVDVVAPNVVNARTHLVDVSSYSERLSALPGVVRVDSATGSYAGGKQVAKPNALSARFLADNATWLEVQPAVYAYSDSGTKLARQIRATPAPFDVIVGGASAALIDTEHSIANRVPLAGALIAIATLILLFLFTGSVVLPFKALILNLLSLTATFGVMVYVFQEGHLRWLVGDFTPTGTLDTTTPILMFCVAFGLSMDYEVFLLSRIREQHALTGDTRMAVATGLERTGRLITAAAALLAIVFLATGTSAVSFIKLFGIGMAVAVIVDATVVRGLLVPAFMRIAGNANWWAPRPLRRFHDKYGVSEDVTILVPAQHEPLDAVGTRT